MKAKHLLLTICVINLALVACDSHKAEEHFSFNRIHYDLAPEASASDLDGAPWINSNIPGMLENIQKPDLKDDFYASINYDSIINDVLGPFEQSSVNASDALQTIVDGTANYPNRDLLMKTKQMLVSGVASEIKAYLDNFDVDSYVSSKEIFYGNSGLFGITYGDDSYNVYFNNGYNYSSYGIQTLAYLGYYGRWYDDYKGFETSGLDVLNTLYKSLGYSEEDATTMAEDGLYYLEEIIFHPAEDLPTWNTVEDVSIEGFKNALLDAGLSLSDNINISNESKNSIINLYSGLDSERALMFKYAIESVYAFEHRYLIGARNYKPLSRILSNIYFFVDEADLTNFSDERVSKRLLMLMLPILFEKAYIHLQGSQEVKDIVEDLIVDILSAYKEMIADVDWLTTKTKKIITKKLNKMRFTSCYADDVKNFTTIEETNLESLSLLDIFDIYYSNVASLSVSGNLDIESTVNSGMHTYTVNAFYNPYGNEFVILNGIVTGGFVDERKEVTYGRIGMVIGHEISHAFDSTGALFNENGEYRKSGWWAKEDTTKFKERVAKLKKFWNKILVHDRIYAKGSNLDGEATADMGGFGVMLQLAKKEENFDYDLFFRSFAEMWKEVYTSLEYIDQDSHPYAYLRTNVTIAQFDEFYKTYGIKKGDGMYIPKSDRVTIW